MQQTWFQRIQQNTSQQHYMIEYREQAIGVINIKAAVNEALEHASTIEVGMYLAPDSRYRGTVLAFSPALAINRYCFEVLACKQLQAVVLADNTKAIRFNEQLGYEVSQVSQDSITQLMSYKNYQRAVSELKKVIRFT